MQLHCGIRIDERVIAVRPSRRYEECRYRFCPALVWTFGHCEVLPTPPVMHSLSVRVLSIRASCNVWEMQISTACSDVCTFCSPRRRRPCTKCKRDSDGENKVACLLRPRQCKSCCRNHSKLDRVPPFGSHLASTLVGTCTPSVPFRPTVARSITERAEEKPRR